MGLLTVEVELIPRLGDAWAGVVFVVFLGVPKIGGRA
jgi:hypothetical protein